MPPNMAQVHMAYPQPQGAPQGAPQIYQVIYPQVPQQQQYQVQPVQSQPVGQNDSQYQTTVPLPNLGVGSAAVDCPICLRRGMTRTEYVVGNTTQYVAYIPPYFSD
jgi:hypothetical protein